MGWLRALLGQKLRSLSWSFAALFILNVRLGYPNLARGVLAEIRPQMLVNNLIQAQECRSIDTMVTKVEFLEDYKKVREAIVHIHDSQNQWKNPSVNRHRIQILYPDLHFYAHAVHARQKLAQIGPPVWDGGIVGGAAALENFELKSP